MLQLIKTWLNSWTTSSRMEHDESVGKCVFCGIFGGDALIHYLRCEPAWTVITSCFQLGSVWIQRSPAQRIGFVNPSLTSLLQVVVAFRVYHVLRQRAREGSLDPDPNVNILSAIDLIRHFLSEVPRGIRLMSTGDVPSSTGANSLSSGYRQSSSRVPVASFSSAVPRVRAPTVANNRVRASPIVQAHGVRSTFVAQADNARPAAWGLDQH